MQVRDDIHTSHSTDLKERFEREESSLHKDGKLFFKLFQESTFEGSGAAALKMRNIAYQQTEQGQKRLLFHCLRFLARSSNSEKLSWPNSPLLVMLQIVDLNVLIGAEETPLQVTPLHSLATLLDPSDPTTHVNQLILAKQLIEHNADVKAVTTPKLRTPLHVACFYRNVTNLDFIELLLKEGADPNAQDHRGLTPLILTAPYAPGAAKFLLNWPTTDIDITTPSGASFLAGIRCDVENLSVRVARPDNPKKVQHQFQLQQWTEIKEMLVQRNAHDTGIEI
jgi:hypothetical protein